MSLLVQRLANLLNGVSQRPHEQRLSSQAQEQKNGLSSVARGLMKRPPLTHLAKLTATTTGWASAFLHSISRDETERYHVVIANGDVFVYDALTFAAITVIAPSGKAYLTDSSSKGFRATTAGDTTVVVNRGKTVRQGTTKFPNQKYEALLYVRQGDYGNTYTVTLNGTAVQYVTPIASPAATETISTTYIATNLFSALYAEPLINTGEFVFSLVGSSVYITRNDGQDFTLSASDGSGDTALRVVKGSLQSFADLPRRAVADFTVQITGDPESDKDNYWVKFDDNGTPQEDGVWKECPQPGTVKDFDSSTMPHRLVRLGHVLENVEHVGVTSVPTAQVLESDAGTVTQRAWATITPAGTVISASVERVELRDHGFGIKLTTGVATTRFEIPYSMDALLVEPGNDVTVKLYIDTVEVASNTHGAGQSTVQPTPPVDSAGISRPFPKGLNLTATGMFFYDTPVDATTDVEIKMFYAKNETPDVYRRAFFSTPLSVALQTAPIRDIRFSDITTYPVGTDIDVVIDAVTFNYVVAGSAKTGAQLATAFKALIDAHATFIAVIGSTLETVSVSRTDFVVPEIEVTADFDEDVTFYNPDIVMIANEHVGRTLRNLTDGSSGTVTSNDVQVVIVGALTGGVDNSFQPGDIISIDGTGRYFVFEPCPWKEREAGDLTICPFPSFKDFTISDVTFYQNRLGFLSNENVVFSEVGNLFNFFRLSAAQLFDSDTIDVKAAHREIALFHSFALWNEELYGISDSGPFSISGEPALAPSTIRIDMVCAVPNTVGPRPLVLGNRLYLTRGKGGYTQVQELSSTASQSGSDVVSTVGITREVPRYLLGVPFSIAGDADAGVMAVLTNPTGGTAQKTLYVYSFYFGDEDGKRLQASWSQWTVAAGDIIGIDMIDGKLGIVSLYSDGIFLSSVDLNVALDTTDPDEKAQYLDRRVTQASTGVSVAYNAGLNKTTWTLPYNTATDGSEGTLVVVRRSDQTILATSSRPAASQIAITGGDYSATSVYIGVVYEYRWKPSRLYFRDQDEQPETSGRLSIKYVDLHYRDTTDFSVVVTLLGRAAYTKTVSLSVPAEGSVHVPIHAENTQATIELVNSTPGACSFTSLDWEGYFSTRDKRA